MTQRIVLADEGKSHFRIIISVGSIPSERYAAEELQKYFERISSVKLPIATDDQPMASSEIMLGDNKHLHSIGLQVNLSKLCSKGFLLRTLNNHLVIVGGRPVERFTVYTPCWRRSSASAGSALRPEDVLFMLRGCLTNIIQTGFLPSCFPKIYGNSRTMTSILSSEKECHVLLVDAAPYVRMLLVKLFLRPQLSEIGEVGAEDNRFPNPALPG